MTLRGLCNIMSEEQSEDDLWALGDKQARADLNKRLAPYCHYEPSDCDYDLICDDANQNETHIASDYTVPVTR